jgi:hypothetical protein
VQCVCMRLWDQEADPGRSVGEKRRRVRLCSTRKFSKAQENWGSAPSASSQLLTPYVLVLEHKIIKLMYLSFPHVCHPRVVRDQGIYLCLVAFTSVPPDITVVTRSTCVRIGFTVTVLLIVSGIILNLSLDSPRTVMVGISGKTTKRPGASSPPAPTNVRPSPDAHAVEHKIIRMTLLYQLKPLFLFAPR